MSDFLTSLVARSFGAPPVIRPRLTSLYEPIRGDATHFGETFAGRNEDNIEVQEEEINAAGREAREAAPRTHTSPEDDEHESTRNADRVRASSLPPHPTHLVREPDRNTITEKVVEKRETRVFSQEMQHRDAAGKAAPNGEIVQQPVLIPKKPSTPAVASLPATQVRPAEKERPGQLISPKITPEMQIPDLALRARPERQRREEHSFPPQPQTSEPTVLVTIGRIEVRATQENARPSRSASVSPVMGLDEYLRKRAQRVGQ